MPVFRFFWFPTGSLSSASRPLILGTEAEAVDLAQTMANRASIKVEVWDETALVIVAEPQTPIISTSADLAPYEVWTADGLVQVAAIAKSASESNAK